MYEPGPLRVMDPGPVSLLPVIATLAVALSLRNVLIGLLAGVVTGVALLGQASIVSFLPVLVRDHLVLEVADSYHASVLVLLIFIGGFVRLIETSGGGSAFAAAAIAWVSDRARAQLAAWFGGIAIFFSDLGTPLIVGPVFQSIFDRLAISRQKLAFVLDSTSSPVAILIPFIGWGVFIMSVIADAFASNGIDQSEWGAFVAAIPFQLYAWLAITMVPVLAWLKVDFGPMRDYEEAARKESTGGVLSVPTVSGGEDELTARPILLWLPLLVLGVVLFATLGPQGFPFAQISGTDFRAGLSAAYLSAAAVLMALLIVQQRQSWVRVFATYVEGMSSMMTIAATLVLAWSLGTVTGALGTGNYIAELASQGVAGWALPALVFLLAAIISFAMGSSWGTFIIMMPLAIPAALATGALLPVTIGAVLSGGLFGDHASPISETTLLSSSGAGVTPLSHFRSQLPYALFNGAIALGMFSLLGASGATWWVLVAILLQILLLWWLSMWSQKRLENTFDRL